MKTAALRKIGNSQGVILDKTLLDLVGANSATVFSIRVEGSQLILDPISKDKQKAMIKEASKKVIKNQSAILKKLAE
jgi:antitoxin component of MazEF toxin-antitoxin module